VPRYRWHTYICKTLTCRTTERHLAASGGLYTLQRRPHRLLGLAGCRRDLRKTKDDTQDDCHARRHAHSVLPTVFDHCTLAIRGKMTTSMIPCSCTPPLLVAIKGGGGLPLKETQSSTTTSTSRNQTTRYNATLSTTKHPILALTSINLSSSRDLGASLPLATPVPPTTGTSGAR
jgi:hypothetical protein